MSVSIPLVVVVAVAVAVADVGVYSSHSHHEKLKEWNCLAGNMMPCIFHIVSCRSTVDVVFSHTSKSISLFIYIYIHKRINFLLNAHRFRLCSARQWMGYMLVVLNDAESIYELANFHQFLFCTPPVEATYQHRASIVRMRAQSLLHFS